MIIAFIYWSTIKQFASVRPVEVSRPLESVRRSVEKRRISPSLLVYVFALASLVVILGGGQEKIFRSIQSYGTIVLATIGIIVVIGMLSLPFSPLALSYIITRHVESSERLFTIASKLSSMLASVSDDVSFHSSMRLGERMRGLAGTSIIAFAVAIGGIFTASSSSGVAGGLSNVYPWILQRDVYNVLESLIGVSVASSTFRTLALLSFVIAALALYTMYNSTFKLVEGECLLCVRRERAGRRH